MSDAAPGQDGLLFRLDALSRNLVAVSFYLVAYYFAYRYGMSFSQAAAAPCWFPDSVLLCALLTISRRWWPGLLLATLPIRLLAAHVEAPTWFILTAFLNDSAKGVLVACLLKIWLDDPLRFRTIRDFGIFCAVAVVAAPALSALAGAAARSVLGDDFWKILGQWFLGDALAQLVVTPFLFYWVVRPPALRGLPGKRWAEALILAAGLLASVALAFDVAPRTSGFEDWRFYLPIVFLGWAAIRFGMHGASAAVAVLAGFAVLAALSDPGLPLGRAPDVIAADMQHFMLLRAPPLFLLAVLMEQRLTAERSVMESERRFRTLADHAPVLIWMSGRDGRCEFFNQGWLEFTGRTIEQERGYGWTAAVHPEDLERCLATYRTSFEARLPFEMEYRLRRFDGEFRWVLDRGAPRHTANSEFAGYLGSAIDVTERRLQEAALRESEERYREVVESQREFVCRFLPDTRLTFVNSAYSRFLGARSPANLIGTPLLLLFPESARSAARKSIQRAIVSREVCSWECESVHGERGRVWHHWVCHTVQTSAGALVELQAIGYDITDRKRVEQVTRQLAQSSRLATLGELTAVIAHQVTQPLSSILSNAEAARAFVSRGKMNAGDLLEILNDIRFADLRAARAIESIRSLACNRTLNLRNVDVVQMVSDVLQLVAPDAAARNVEIVWQPPAHLPPVCADPAAIEQVLLNLIMNGMDAVRCVRNAAMRVIVEARAAGNVVELAVRDCGSGIAPEKMRDLFSAFFTTKKDGLGLGLWFARSVVEAHGGRIWAESGQGQTVFRFTLHG